MNDDRNNNVKLSYNNSQQRQQQEEEGRDAERRRLSHGLMRFFFGMMGLGILIPYSSLIACVDFYAKLYPERNDIAGQLTAVNISALVLTTFLLMIFTGDEDEDLITETATSIMELQTRKKKANFISFLFHDAKMRVYFGFFMILVGSVILTVAQYPSMSLLLVISLMFGAADSISQSGILVLANRCDDPPAYNASVQIGVAVIAMAVSWLRLGTRGLFPTDTIEGLAAGSSLLYGIVAVIMILCLLSVTTIVFFASPSSPLLSSSSSSPHHPTVSNECNHDSNDSVDLLRCPNTICTAQMTAATSDIYEDEERKQEQLSTKQPLEFETHTVPLSSYLSSPSNLYCFCHHWEVYRTVLRYTWKPTISTFFTFFVTLSLFPGIISSIISSAFFSTSSASSFSFGEWLTVVLITIYNVADFLGRILVGNDRIINLLISCQEETFSIELDGDDNDSREHQEQRRLFFPHYQHTIWVVTWMRSIFIPLIILCVYPSYSSPVIGNDIMRSTIIFLLGLTNGVIVTANFAIIPQIITTNINVINLDAVHYHSYQDTAQLLNLLALFLGLASGSYTGLGLDAFLREIITN